MLKNALSVDVEEIFHGEYVRRYRTSNVTYRTPENILPILNFFKEHKISATFFVVGEIAEKYPDVIRLIKKDGHEVAFHGWSHHPLWKLDPDSFRAEVVRFKDLCPDCIGYRAPSFSLNNSTRWALNVLRDEGFKYDSSIFPTWTPLYGAYRSPTTPYRPSFENISKENENHKADLVEFPLLIYNFAGLKIPAAGGFWLRLWNIELIAKAIRSANNSGFPATLFFHNWEVDDKVQKFDMPRINRFITYYNLEAMKYKLISILRQYKFTSFRECLFGHDKENALCN
jgi:polysaccharide deacetylase family protein (PEP-CTERM system associated)